MRASMTSSTRRNSAQRISRVFWFSWCISVLRSEMRAFMSESLPLECIHARMTATKVGNLPTKIVSAWEGSICAILVDFALVSQLSLEAGLPLCAGGRVAYSSARLSLPRGQVLPPAPLPFRADCQSAAGCQSASHSGKPQTALASLRRLRRNSSRRAKKRICSSTTLD
jgi:hypothetical protein